MALCRKPLREFLKAKGIISGTDLGLEQQLPYIPHPECYLD